jgi:hypothetical protein
MSRTGRAFLGIAAAVALLVAPLARGEPYIAVQQGYKCESCHFNPTGGGLRTEFGSVFSENVLPANHIDMGQPWLGKLGDMVRVGADLRTDWSYTDVPHTSIEKGFNLEQVRAYANVALIPKRLDLYVDEQLAPGGATAMEAYGRYTTGGDGQWYVKGGRFYLPFGWRLQDNTAFVREVSGISMTTPDNGVEVGFERPEWSAQLDFTNGAANTSGSGHQVTAQAVNVHSIWRVGLGASFTQAEAGNKRVGTIFGGLRTGPVAWLAEGDIVRDLSFAPARTMLASLLEANWLVRRGHNVKLTYEYQDPDHSVHNNGQTRASALYEVTPIQFLQLRLGYRRYRGIPQNNEQNMTLAFIEMHVFL